MKGGFVYVSYYGGHMHVGKGNTQGHTNTFDQYQHAGRMHGPSKDFALSQAAQVRDCNLI